MKSFWIWREPNSNRALVRDGGEKWPDDVNGEPSDKWLHVTDFSAYSETLSGLRIIKNQQEEISDLVSSYIRNFERDPNCDCCNNNLGNLEELKDVGVFKL